MINLNNFVKEIFAEVPVNKGKFVFNRKQYEVPSEDGWFKVSLKGNYANIVEPIYYFDNLEKKYNRLLGYSYNNLIIFQNFDAVKRKTGKDVSAVLNFNKSDSFNPIRCICWEDGQFYYTQQDYSSNYKIHEIKNFFDSDRDISQLKGVTPEIRTTYLFHCIERDQVRELEKIKLAHLAEEDRREHEKQMMATVQGRVQLTFNRSGASLLNYSLSGKRIMVDWELNGHKFNSIIDADSFKVIEAGYCMSGEDTKHNITSLVKLAEDYDDRDLIYITRS